MSQRQYLEHCADRDFQRVAQALLLNLADRSTPKWQMLEQVRQLEWLLPMCGDSLETDIKRQRFYALKAKVEGTRLRVVQGGAK
jgi:alpha-D-ribose 1-methylphosphonate 5-triphosphate synthase subunit PhnH